MKLEDIIRLEDVEGLYPHERALINIIRNFDFLRIYSYHIDEIAYGGRENPSLVFLNYSTKMKIHIIGSESQDYSVQIQRKKFFAIKREELVFDIKDFYQYFNCELTNNINYSLKIQADFVQKFLLPVIKNEVWINDLINKIRYKNYIKNYKE